MTKKPSIIKNDAPNDVLFWRTSLNHLHKKTQLLVGPTDVAFFEKAGVLLNTLESGQYKIFSQKTSLLTKAFLKKPEEDISVLFMNKTVKNQVLWGTPIHLNFVDPMYDETIQLGASGTLDISISNPRKFYHEIIGRNKDYTLQDLKTRIKSKLISLLETHIHKQMTSHQKTYLNLIDSKESVENILNEQLITFLDELGIQGSNFSLNTFFITEESTDKLISKKISLKKSLEEDQEDKETKENQTEKIEDEKESIDKEKNVLINEQ